MKPTNWKTYTALFLLSTALMFLFVFYLLLHMALGISLSALMLPFVAYTVLFGFFTVAHRWISTFVDKRNYATGIGLLAAILLMIGSSMVVFFAHYLGYLDQHFTKVCYMVILCSVLPVCAFGAWFAGTQADLLSRKD